MRGSTLSSAAYTAVPLLKILKILFIRYSMVWASNKKFKVTMRVGPAVQAKCLHVSKITVYGRRYSKRFYRKVLSQRYDRSISHSKLALHNWNSSIQWDKPLNLRASFKPYFHVKTIFNLNEYLMYDFYNFHKTSLTSNFKPLSSGLKGLTIKLWKKINFFFYIRHSINVFRTHTLQFFKVKFRNDRKVTVFFNGFKGLSTLAYIWFFEFSIPYFLVKVRFAESMSQGMSLALNGAVFADNNNDLSRWSVVQPGSCVQLLFNSYTVARSRWLILGMLKFFRRVKRLLRRTVLRSRKYRTKIPSVSAKGAYLTSTKAMNFRLFEVDYKSMTALLLPYNNPTVYLTTLTLFWLNFWNYRLTAWKYEI